MNLTIVERTEIYKIMGEVNRAGYMYGWHAAKCDMAKAMEFKERERIAMNSVQDLFKRWEERS